MDSTTFTNITGTPVPQALSGRFNYLANQAGEKLAEALGYPLDPSDWSDQYEEIGKTTSASWNGNLADLDAPDEVQGKTRLFKWSRNEPYLYIDPALHIYSLKLVRMDSYGSDEGNGVTYKTLDPSSYSLSMRNGAKPWGKYVRMSDDFIRWRDSVLWFQLPSLVCDEGLGADEYLQVAVDADWGFNDLPGALLEAQADIIDYALDAKRDVTSERVLGHSYTRNGRQNPMTKHAELLAQYAGPHGTAGSHLVLA